MRQSTLVFAPHLNSFRRLSPNQHAPINLTWGTKIELPLFAFLVGSNQIGELSTVLRCDTNIYLVLAAILGAALDGLKNCTEAPNLFPVTVLMTPIKKESVLPTTWFEAISYFEDGDLIGGTINSVIHDMMIRTKNRNY